jgi:hypothetical protein
MAQKKKKRCPKCGWVRRPSKFRSGCSVCEHCEKMLRDMATRNYNYGAIPPLTQAEKRIYSKP